MLAPDVFGIGILGVCYQSEMRQKGFLGLRLWAIAAPPASNSLALLSGIWDRRPLSTHLPAVPSFHLVL